MQVGKENAELALSLVGYSDELKVYAALAIVVLEL